MLFHRASEEREAAILTGVGIAVAACVVIVVVIAALRPSEHPSADSLDIAIESPYAGQGVDVGTPVLLHGVKVGRVTQVASLPQGGVRMTTELERKPTGGLTDSMGFDFRPANYFGVTSINLRGGQGGGPLAAGTLIKSEPAGNFTLQTLLSRLGEVTSGVVSPRLIAVIERGTTYMDGLDPLLETMLVVANSFANVQTVSTATLLTNATGISVAFPGFVNGAVNAGDLFLHGGLDGASEDFFQNTYKPTIDFAATELFGAAGKLVTSHSTELAPLTNMIKILTDIGPGLVPSDAIADTAREYRTRLERLFGGPPGRRAVNVRVILDSLPGVAAPIQEVGAMPAAESGQP
ncbi:Mammalian cell entry related domain protein [Mycolicibacterium rhodesiae JS60]|nr:Mammalian cell entry related domain protein [Mycolicibacterium rhodesiae JS60]